MLPKQMQTSKTALGKVSLAIGLGLLLSGFQPCDATSDIFLRLQTSRDALLVQERDIRASYDDVTRQIDDLRKKQMLLDSYLSQTRSAIRGVERAMESAR